MSPPCDEIFATMPASQSHKNWFEIDNRYGRILRHFICTGAQKRDTAMTLLLFAIKSDVTMTYSHWHHREGDGTQQYDTNLWLAIRTHDKVSMSAAEICLWRRICKELNRFEGLSDKDVNKVMSIYQYKQWVAQFEDVVLHPPLSEDSVRNMQYVYQLLNSPERMSLDRMLDAMLADDSSTYDSVVYDANIMCFLHLFHARIEAVIAPQTFDSVFSAANLHSFR